MLLDAVIGCYYMMSLQDRKWKTNMKADQGGVEPPNQCAVSARVAKQDNAFSIGQLVLMLQ